MARLTGASGSDKMKSVEDLRSNHNASPSPRISDKSIPAAAAVQQITQNFAASVQLASDLEQECRTLRLELAERKAAAAERWAAEAALHSKLQAEVTRSKLLEETLYAMQQELAIRDAQTMIAMERAGEFANMYCMSQEEILSQKLKDQQLQTYSKYLETKVIELTKSAEELHSRIFKMQGNIRVLCRVRPLTQNELARPNFNVTALDNLINFKEFNCIEFNGSPYEFDRIMGPSVTQEECYREVEPMIDAVMGGCRVCIFAYGQTGSGKTYTMEGPVENRGLSMRAVDTIFTLAAASATEYRTDVIVSILEVYNERIIDLLGQTQSSPPPNASGTSSLEVRVGKNGVFVEGLGQWLAANSEEVHLLMERGSAMRQVASNNVNEHSSRSHLVTIVKVRKYVR